MTEPASSGSPSSGRSLRLLLAGAALTVVVGFAVGFGLGERGSTDADEATTAAGPATSVPSTVPPSSSVPTTELAPTTTVAPPTTVTTTTTSVVTTTEAPTTTVVVVPTAVVTTPAPTTMPPPTLAPSRVVVSYAADAGGRLVVPRSGAATLVVTNEGGLAQQWLVTGTGFTTAGPTQGSLAGGQSVTVTILPPPGELPLDAVTGTISVLGATNPSVGFVIPPA